MSTPSNNVHEAAAQGDVTFLSSNRQLLNLQNDRGWTPLHFAARYGQTETVRFLVAEKVDTKLVNSEGKTAAKVARFWGFEEVAKILDAEQESSVTTPGTQEVATATINRGRFSENYQNFFAGGKLNRFGFLRTENAYLTRTLTSPTSRFLLLSNGRPLFDTTQPPATIAWLSYPDIADIIGNPYQEEAIPAPLGEGKDEFIIVFLGVLEENGEGPDSGPAYWVVDVSPRGSLEDKMTALEKNLSERKFDFVEPRPKAFKLETGDAAILAQARAMVDWNYRNQYCPACGRRTVSMDAGHKRTCPPDEEAPAGSVEAKKKVTPPCKSKGVQNFSYPRTDPVVIVCVVHPTEDKVLLGRQKTWPKGMYSALAGFIEAGESMEEAVRREVKEEAGIVIGNVAYHSSQPWPFPNSLMIGCLAEAVTDIIKLEDKELEEARWFTRPQVIEALSQSKLPFEAQSSALIRMPPETAIAHQLVKTWALEKEWSGAGVLAK
ncbi:NUDIX hydrolase domain-like protein, partial [Endogone sp. FLAS-F59071]